MRPHFCVFSNGEYNRGMFSSPKGHSLRRIRKQETVIGPVSPMVAEMGETRAKSRKTTE